MAYCTEQNLIDRFGADEIRQLSDRDRDGTNDPDVIAGVIADATAEMDGWFSGRWTIPDPAPQEVVRRACDIARYMLFDDRVTEVVRERYQAAIAWLRDVAAGRVAVIGATPVVTDGVVGTGAVSVASSEITFTDDLLKKTQVGD